MSSNSKMLIGEGQPGSPGWRDMIGTLTVRRATGAGVPTFDQIGVTPFYAYTFAVNDTILVTYHPDHDYAVGTPIYFHAHWMKNGTNVQPVKWEFTIAYAKGYGREAFPFSAPTVTSVTQTPAATAFTHEIAEIATPVDLDWEVDGLIMVSIKRVTNGGTDNTDTVSLLTADLHYQTDRTMTKEKNYPFY
jgi:hypothetical protein